MSLLIHIDGKKVRIASVPPEFEDLIYRLGSTYEKVDFDQLIRPDDIRGMKAKIEWLEKVVEAHNVIKRETE